MQCPFLAGFFGSLLGISALIHLGLHDVRENEKQKDHKEDQSRERVHIRRDLSLGHRINVGRQGVEALALGKLRDDEIVKREGEGHQCAREHARQNGGELNEEEGAQGSTAEIGRRLGKILVTHD